MGLLEAQDVPLVEDDFYADLAFQAHRPPAVKAFDRHGLVLYCGSYSKTLSPGLRVGWAIPGRYQSQVELPKLVVNQATARAPQLAVAAFVESGGFKRHLRRVRRMYREQMADHLDAVTRSFPAGTRATRPDGGHALWVQLPPASTPSPSTTWLPPRGLVSPRSQVLPERRLPQLHPPQHRLPMAAHGRTAEPPRPARRRPASHRIGAGQRRDPPLTDSRSAGASAPV